MNESVLKELECFLENPSPENFLRLRAATAATKDYLPYGRKPEEVGEFLARGDFSRAQATLVALMPGYFLNPGIHTLLSFIRHKLGDEAGAGVEFDFGVSFLSGILSTGDGDEIHPYQVLYVNDEYDVLEHLSKKSHSQSLVSEGHRMLDRHDCEDGAKVWFDITTPYSALVRGLANGQPSKSIEGQAWQPV